jgi:hypothetical protein
LEIYAAVQVAQSPPPLKSLHFQITPMKPQPLDHFMFVTFPIAVVVILMFWTLVRSIIRRRARRKAVVNRNFKREWEEFCAREGLDNYSRTSTR